MFFFSSRRRLRSRRRYESNFGKHTIFRPFDIQFSTVFLHVNGNLNRNAVIRNRCRRICQGFLLAVSIQTLTLDNGRKILIADIQIHIAVDTSNLTLFRMLPDAISTTVIGLVDPVRQPDRVPGLDIIGSMCGQR